MKPNEWLIPRNTLIVNNNPPEPSSPVVRVREVLLCTTCGEEHNQFCSNSFHQMMPIPREQWKEQMDAWYEEKAQLQDTIANLRLLVYDDKHSPEFGKLMGVAVKAAAWLTRHDSSGSRVMARELLRSLTKFKKEVKDDNQDPVPNRN